MAARDASGVSPAVAAARLRARSASPSSRLRAQEGFGWQGTARLQDRIHGTSRLYRPPSPEMIEALESTRASARESQRASARRHADMRWAGVPTSVTTNPRPRQVKVERGEAALRTLGSEQWATAGDQEAPRLISTMMMSYGITAVPPWRHGHCEGTVK